MFVKRGLKPALTQPAPAHPLRRQRGHFRQQLSRFEIGRAEKLQRARRAPSFRQIRAFQHYSSRITAGHPEIRGIGTRIYPYAISQSPTVAWRPGRFPALHGYDFAFHIEMKRADKPPPELAECEPMAHRQ